MTLHDMLEQGITLQGEIVVYSWKGDDDSLKYEGDGDELSRFDCMPWMFWDIQYIYPDYAEHTRSRVHFDLIEED